MQLISHNNDIESMPYKICGIERGQVLKNLKILRKKAKLTQSKLAKMLHVDRQVIYKYEKGINQASFDTLVKMSEIFNVPVEYLINDEIDIGSYIEEKIIKLSSFEQEFLMLFRGMDKAAKKNIINICKKLIEIERYK